MTVGFGMFVVPKAIAAGVVSTTCFTLWFLKAGVRIGGWQYKVLLVSYSHNNYQYYYK
jgi:hypothetical protein